MHSSVARPESVVGACRAETINALCMSQSAFRDAATISSSVLSLRLRASAQTIQDQHCRGAGYR
jgi:hypothetical protein